MLYKKMEKRQSDKEKVIPISVLPTNNHSSIFYISFYICAFVHMCL